MASDKMSADVNAQVFVQSKARHAEILKKHALYNGVPQRLSVDAVLSSPWNRKPNLAYIHTDLCPSIEKDGFDPERCQAGYVIKRSSPDCVANLIKYNEELGSGGFMPPIHTSEVGFEALGSQHLTISLRLFKTQTVSPISGAAFKVPSHDTDLQSRLRDGHYYKVIDDKISEADARFLAEWQNIDQQKNQGNSEQALMQKIYDEVCQQQKICPIIKMSAVSVKICNSSIMKLKVDQVSSLVRYCVEQGKFVEEALHYCARYVNPKELAISPRWFTVLCETMGKTCPLVKLNMHLIHLDPTNVFEQVRPAPDICRSITQADMNSVMKTPEKVQAAEKIMVDHRALVRQSMISLSSWSKATELIRAFEGEITRMLFSKSLNEGEFNHKLSGKFDEDKAKDLQKRWFTWASMQNIVFAKLAEEVQ